MSFESEHNEVSCKWCFGMKDQDVVVSAKIPKGAQIEMIQASFCPICGRRFEHDYWKEEE